MSDPTNTEKEITDSEILDWLEKGDNALSIERMGGDEKGHWSVKTSLWRKSLREACKLAMREAGEMAIPQKSNGVRADQFAAYIIFIDGILQPPPYGEWHHGSDFTLEDLRGGYRPLLVGELVNHEVEVQAARSSEWFKLSIPIAPYEPKTWKCRTKLAMTAK